MARTDSERLDYLETECRTLECVEERTEDDADVGFAVKGYWQAEPRERQIGYGRTVREAIDNAMDGDGLP